MSRAVQWTAWIVATIMAFGGVILYQQSRKKGRVVYPAPMTYPAGFAVTGNPDTGLLCHQSIRRYTDGNPDKVLKTHFIDGKDFRDASEIDKKAWLEADANADSEETGIACYDDPWFFRPAYAQPHCEDDCGGGCIQWTCPAHFNLNGYCVVPGSDCAITYYCCGVGCHPSC